MWGLPGAGDGLRRHVGKSGEHSLGPGSPGLGHARQIPEAGGDPAQKDMPGLTPGRWQWLWAGATEAWRCVRSGAQSAFRHTWLMIESLT